MEIILRLTHHHSIINFFIILSECNKPMGHFNHVHKATVKHFNIIFWYPIISNLVLIARKVDASWWKRSFQFEYNSIENMTLIAIHLLYSVGVSGPIYKKKIIHIFRQEKQDGFGNSFVIRQEF